MTSETIRGDTRPTLPPPPEIGSAASSLMSEYAHLRDMLLRGKSPRTKESSILAKEITLSNMNRITKASGVALKKPKRGTREREGTTWKRVRKSRVGTIDHQGRSGKGRDRLMIEMCVQQVAKNWLRSYTGMTVET